MNFIQMFSNCVLYYKVIIHRRVTNKKKTRTETLLCSDLSVGLGVEASSLVIDFNYPDLEISLPQRSIQQSNAALHDSSPFSIIEVICFALFFCIRSLGVLYFMAKFSVH